MTGPAAPGPDTTPDPDAAGMRIIIGVLVMYIVAGLCRLLLGVTP